MCFLRAQSTHMSGAVSSQHGTSPVSNHRKSKRKSQGTMSGTAIVIVSQDGQSLGCTQGIEGAVADLRWAKHGSM